MAATGAAFGQQSPMYFATASGVVEVYQNQALQYSFQNAYSPGQETVIAVGPSWVRTGSYAPYSNGGEYQLNGTSNNVYLPRNTVTSDYAYDGAYDGKYIYTCDYSSPGDVVRYDDMYNGQAVQFQTGAQGRYYDMGITCDRGDGTIWTANYGYGSGLVTEWDSNGNPLRSWNVNTGSGNIPGLAWDPADDTLWLSNNYSGTFQQYDENGKFLQEFPLSQYGFFGGLEIGGKVPAPGSAALLGLGGLMASRRRR